MGIVDVIVVGALALGVADYVVPKRHKKRLNDLVAELWFKLSAFTYREVALKASSRALMYMSKAFRNEQGIVRVKLISVVFLIAYSIPVFTGVATRAYEIFYLDDIRVKAFTEGLTEDLNNIKTDNQEKRDEIAKFISYFKTNGREFFIFLNVSNVIYEVSYSIFTNIAPSAVMGIISMLVTLYLLERARFFENPLALIAISAIDFILAIAFVFISMSIVIFLAKDLDAYLSARYEGTHDVYFKIVHDAEINFYDYITIAIYEGPQIKSDASSVSSLLKMVIHSFHEILSGNIQIGIFAAFLNYNMLLSLFPTIFHLSLIFLLIFLKCFDFLLRKPMLFTLEWINGHEKGAVAPVAALVGLGAKLIEKAVS